jgi:hypothetical protein
MTRTVLTAEQYSELVVALEAMRAVYTTSDYGGQPQQCLRDLYVSQAISAWAMVYLIQWFYLIEPWVPPGRDSIVWACAHMVAELCKERC